MKYLFFLFTAFLFSFIQVNAQHCPFDNSCIVVIDVRASDTAKGTIKNLKITLLDSTNQPVIKYGIKYTEDYKEQHIPDGFILFEQNNPARDIAKLAQSTEFKDRLWFAKDNYILVNYPYRLFYNSKIKIEDIDGMDNGGNFKTTIVNISYADVYSLCMGKSDWYYSYAGHFVKGYKPIKVILKPL